MIKKTLTGIMAAAAMYLAPGQLPAYDKNDNNITTQNIEYIADSVVRVEADIVYEDHQDKKVSMGIYTVQGSGIVLMDEDTRENYVLSAGHLFPRPDEHTLSVVTEIRADGIKCEYKKVALDEDDDFLLCKPNATLDAKPFRGLATKKVKMGDYVIGFGYPGGLEKSLYDGRVTYEDEKSVHVSAPINSGQSGGPVFVFDNGIAKLFGLNRFKYIGVDGIGGITRPDRLEEFLRDTAIGDDYYKGGPDEKG